MNLSNLHLEFRKLLTMPLFSVSSTKTTLASALVGGAVLAAPFALGCASAPVNPPLETIDPTGGYRFENTAPGENNSDELFVMVSLSGGGTRATALDYGVLAHLDEIGIGSGDRSLLDEVDLIASSSAASLAAAYFGLFGQERFLTSFRDEVLYRKLEGALKRRFLTPWQWPRMWSARFSRSDLAAEYIDRQIFEKKTYADMPRKRPFVLINATDLSLGALFSFSQGQFDLLCSNLDGVSVGRAVTASMAFTGAFRPMTFTNYDASSCGYSRPDWIHEALEDGLESSSRRYDRAVNLTTYEDSSKRPYIHLLDSGIADNIGLRALKLAFVTRDVPWSIVDRLDHGSIRRLVVIIVDSKQARNLKPDQRARPPRLTTSVTNSVSSTLDNYSSETVQVVRQGVADREATSQRFEEARQSCDRVAQTWCSERQSEEGCVEEHQRSCYSAFNLDDKSKPADTDVYLVHLRFSLLEDPDLRSHLDRLPTRLQLPRADIDLLIDSASAMMSASGPFQSLLRDLDTQKP